MSGWYAGPGYRDQFTAEEEYAQALAQEYEEDYCTCAHDGHGGRDPAGCPVHEAAVSSTTQEPER